MPKATLTFNLPDEQDEFDQTLLAGDMTCFIHEFGERLRIKYKHSEPIDGRTPFEEYEEIKRDFFALLAEYGL